MKALAYILVIAGVIFSLARPIALRFIDEVDFVRRRNVWYALTIIAFISPNFWFFALFALPLYIWLGRRDSNPLAAYILLLHVVPPVSVDIPVLGIGQLFSLDNYRLLAICIVLPVAIRARRIAKSQQENASRTTDQLLFFFGILSCWLFIPPDLPNHVVLTDSGTNFLRRLFLFSLDYFILYYAISRSCDDKRKIIDAQATFGLAAAIMAVIAAFEHFRGWLLYIDLANHWSRKGEFSGALLMRGDSWLRAPASAGHALSLGVFAAVAFGFWLSLKDRSKTLLERIVPSVIYWCGIIAGYSRGPGIGAILIYLTYSALQNRALTRFFKSALIIAIAVGVASLTPFGDKLIDSITGGSGQPDATFAYRQRLLDRSIELIRLNPFFGDQLAMHHMEDLRQGEGIIDIVNAYVGVALFNGLIGLALFVGFIASAGLGVFRAAKATASADPSWSRAGFNILSCLFGLSFMIAGVSLVYAVPKVFYAVIGLAAAYVRSREMPFERAVGKT